MGKTECPQDPEDQREDGKMDRETNRKTNGKTGQSRETKPQDVARRMAEAGIGQNQIDAFLKITKPAPPLRIVTRRDRIKLLAPSVIIALLGAATAWPAYSESSTEESPNRLNP